MLQVEPGSWVSRFLSFVARTEDPKACWLWFGATQQQGYGLWTFYPPAHPKKKLQVAHRVMWELVKGPIPDGLELDHLCKQKSCVNPDHLEPVTHKVNLQRAKTHCKRGHLLEETRTVYRKDGKGYCGICRKAWTDRRRVAPQGTACSLCGFKLSGRGLFKRGDAFVCRSEKYCAKRRGIK